LRKHGPVFLLIIAFTSTHQFNISAKIYLNSTKTSMHQHH